LNKQQQEECEKGKRKKKKKKKKKKGNVKKEDFLVERLDIIESSAPKLQEEGEEGEEE